MFRRGIDVLAGTIEVLLEGVEPADVDREVRHIRVPLRRRSRVVAVNLPDLIKVRRRITKLLSAENGSRSRRGCSLVPAFDRLQPRGGRDQPLLAVCGAEQLRAER